MENTRNRLSAPPSELRADSNDEKGFTLVELMITIAILAVLASVAIPVYRNYVNRAKQANAIIALKAAQMAEEQFYSENNVYCFTIDMLPGFSDTSSPPDNKFKKGEYTLQVVSVSTSTTPSFVIAATWVDTAKSIDDRWTISNTNTNPQCDTSKAGIPGESLFEMLFK